MARRSSNINIRANRRGFTPGGSYVMPNATPRPFSQSAYDRQTQRMAIRSDIKTIAAATGVLAASGLLYTGAAVTPAVLATRRRRRINARRGRPNPPRVADVAYSKLKNTTRKNKNTQRTTTKGHKGTPHSAATTRPGTRSSDLRNVNRGGRKKKTNWVKDSQGRFAGSR